MPYRPIAASHRDNNPKKQESALINRSCASDSSTCVASVLILKSGRLASISRAACLTAAIELRNFHVLMLTTYRNSHRLLLTNNRSPMEQQKNEVLPGTLNLMALKTLNALGPLHGYGIARRIEQISG